MFTSGIRGDLNSQLFDTADAGNEDGEVLQNLMPLLQPHPTSLAVKVHGDEPIILGKIGGEVRVLPLVFPQPINGSEAERYLAQITTTSQNEFLTELKKRFGLYLMGISPLAKLPYPLLVLKLQSEGRGLGSLLLGPIEISIILDVILIHRYVVRYSGFTHHVIQVSLGDLIAQILSNKQGGMRFTLKPPFLSFFLVIYRSIQLTQFYQSFFLSI